ECPAVDDPAREVHVAARSLRELESLVERRDEELRSPTHLPQALRVECRADRVRGGSLAGGRERDRGDPVLEERPLLVETEREGEVDELPEQARPPGRRVGCCADPGDSRAEERRRGRVR